VVDGTPATKSIPTGFSLVTGSNSTNRLERLRVSSLGDFSFNGGVLYLDHNNNNIGINTKITEPSGILDIHSTTKGIYIPRMTKDQRDNIDNPNIGLLIYQTNENPGFYYNTTFVYDTPVWENLATSSSVWQLNGNK